MDDLDPSGSELPDEIELPVESDLSKTEELFQADLIAVENSLSDVKGKLPNTVIVTCI